MSGMLMEELNVVDAPSDASFTEYVIIGAAVAIFIA